MTLSIYDISVPAFIQGLTGLSWVLAKADTHVEGDGAALMSDRVAADMLPFGFQIAQSISHSVGAVQRLTGKGDLVAPIPATLADARTAIADAIAYLKAVTPEDFDGAETRAITWDPMKNGGFQFVGLPYLVGFATPNFNFHSAMAYAIARKNCVPIGKRDFMARGDAPGNL